MSYKNLNLDKERITSVIDDMGIPHSSPATKGNGAVHVEFFFEGEPNALLILFHNNNGTTTIGTTSGQNKSRSEEIAAYILENCTISDAGKTSSSLYFKIQEQDFNDVIDYLEECGAKIDKKTISGGLQCSCTGKHGDKLVIKFFDKKGAMQVQGKHVMLYADLVEILCEILPYEDVIRPQLEFINVNCEPNVIRNELSSALPHAYDFLHEKTKALLTPSLALKKINIPLEDYSAFVMPALRGLEAYINQLFLEKGITIGKDGFNKHLTNTIPHELNENAKNTISCKKTIKAIEHSYRFYAKNRHSLFHADGTVSGTVIIENHANADKLVRDTLDVINDTYGTIVL
jgi:hypothetical protein